MLILGADELKTLLTHVVRWLANLGRANDERKKASITAVREVILVARRTATYLRHVEQTGQQDVKQEQDLAERWTRLGFAMQDLGLGKLAKRCDIRGRAWADPAQFTPEFIEKADVSLDSIERLATAAINDVNGKPVSN
ncbi:MAG TPA: hypothetical protein VF050_10455 [Moraxellaceae bacterium]